MALIEASEATQSLARESARADRGQLRAKESCCVIQFANSGVPELGAEAVTAEQSRMRGADAGREKNEKN